MMILEIVVAATLAGSAPAPARNVPSAERVRELLTVTGAAESSRIVIDQMMQSFHKMFPQVPDKLWNEMADVLQTEDLLDLTVPVYQEHLSAEDLELAIAFWKSEAGQRFREAQPAILSESMQLGQAWGQKKAQEVLGRLKERGYVPGQPSKS